MSWMVVAMLACRTEVPGGCGDERTWYADADGDGFGDAASSTTSCRPPTGHVEDATDCDDGDAGRSPGALELPCDTIDQDCDGFAGEPGMAASVAGLEYPTLGEAVAAAADGDVVDVCPGTWSEALVLTDRTLTLRAASGAPEDTVFDGLDAQTPIVVYGGRVTIENVSFVNGLSTVEDPAYADQEGPSVTAGGAVHAEDADLRLEGCRFENNRTDPMDNWAHGGAVFAWASGDRAVEVTITASTFVNNVATSVGGAVYIEGWEAGEGLVATISGSVFEGNSADGSTGALQVVAEDLLVEDCTFTGNSAEWCGALGAGGGAGADLAVVRSTFEGNRATVDCGAAAVGAGTGARFEISQSTFRENQAANDGGALCAQPIDGTVVVSGSTFENNVAEGQGGGLSGQPQGGVVLIEDSTFQGNEAGSGGAVAFQNWFYAASLAIEDSTFHANRAEQGGALVLRPYRDAASKLDVSSCAIVGNEATKGGAVAVEAWGAAVPSDLRFDATDVSGNTASTYGAAVLVSGPILLRFVESSVTGNSSAGAGGVVYQPTCDLLSAESNWGEGTTENAPADVTCGDVVSSFGAAASFTCDEAGCL